MNREGHSFHFHSYINIQAAKLNLTETVKNNLQIFILLRHLPENTQSFSYCFLLLLLFEIFTYYICYILLILCRFCFSFLYLLLVRDKQNFIVPEFTEIF